MITLKWINVEEENASVFKFDKAIKKYKLLQDRKLAFAAKFLKSHSKSKYHSISHSYPICIIAESDEKIGVDIENSNRRIDWEKIVAKKFSKNDRRPLNRNSFFLDWTTREAYFKCTQDKHYLNVTLEEITDKWIISIKHIDDFYIAVCSANQQDIKNEAVSLKNSLD
jgi:hypothetical protein